MTLADTLSSPPAADDAPRIEADANGGTFSGIRSTKPITDWSNIFAEFDLDPDVFEVVEDTVRMSKWQQSKRLENGHRDIIWLYSYRGSFRRRSDRLDLPALHAAARQRKPRPFKPVDSDRVTVVVLSDVQAGKVGSRGGTPELIERMADTRHALAAHLRARKPSRLVLAEAGDLFEGFESGGNPMFTNDLSLTEQMDLASTELYEFVQLMQRHGPVEVMAVPSNHTAWRNGKQNLGRPGDDLGLGVHRQVAKLAAASRLNAHWNFPRAYDESMALDVGGAVLGLVHGNQFSPGRAAEWWSKQQHGGQPVGAADVLITGHYHHLAVMPTGRNPHTGRAKWWLQAPTLDNGSDWYRNVQGDDSSPGLLVFDVTSDGFDLQSLTVL
ncbi:hypothetical protein SK224_05465 [Microbacterium sp. BG28]|uniref:hypothetical protein n=1 Tax=Microbacterium sp. BG28 TaxID=3097356 RepID=UPI002A5A7781|nr:hypothetical protein [Microbacterium sp. BG28]MDY0828573.1 hypothetical protein [Microbacterium sp. BG28]